MERYTVNGRSYRWSAEPVTVVCVDGCEKAYLDKTLARGQMPRIADMLERRGRGTARGDLPLFTNVKNAAIVTGVAPAVNGISGNFFLDPDTGRECSPAPRIQT